MNENIKVSCDICDYANQEGVMGFDGVSLICRNKESKYFGNEISLGCKDCLVGKTSIPEKYLREMFQDNGLKTEITQDKIEEWYCPCQGFESPIFNIGVTDYAELHIDHTGIQRLEENINPEFTERIIVFVHFKTGTNEFVRMFIEVTAYDDSNCACSSEIVDIELTDEEKNNIIEAAIVSIEEHRKAGTVLDC